jgi:hypothetical protein
MLPKFIGSGKLFLPPLVSWWSRMHSALRALTTTTRAARSFVEGIAKAIEWTREHSRNAVIDR